MVSTPLGENVRIDKVYKDFPIVLSCKTMREYLIELPMYDFDIIFCMDCLYSCYASLDCRSSEVRFYFLDEEELVCEGYNSSRPNSLILNLKQ